MLDHQVTQRPSIPSSRGIPLSNYSDTSYSRDGEPSSVRSSTEPVVARKATPGRRTRTRQASERESRALQDQWEDTDAEQDDHSDSYIKPSSEGSASNKSSPRAKRAVERPVGLAKRIPNTPTRRRQVPGGSGVAGSAIARSGDGSSGGASPLRRRRMVREDSGKASEAARRSTAQASESPKDTSQPHRSTSHQYILFTIDVLVRALRVTAIILQMIISILTPLLSLILTLLSPLLAPVLGVLAASAAIYFLPSMLTSRLLSPLISWPISLLWRLAGVFPSPIRLSLPDLSSLPGDIRHNWAYAVSTAPFRYIAATPLCTLSGALCEAAPATVAPIWAWSVWQRSWRPALPKLGLGERKRLDVGRMAHGLSTEVRHARDIFESVAELGTYKVQAGLDHLVCVHLPY